MDWQRKIPIIIAELGENVFPFGLGRLSYLVNAAAHAGADAVKVQLYTPEHFPAHERAAKERTTFPRERFGDFVSLAHSHGLAAGASVFDPWAVDLVMTSGADFLKLAIRECFNTGLLNDCLLTDMPLVRSVPWPPLGTVDSHGPRVTTLACIPQYPTPAQPLHMEWLANLLPAPWGWSSHSVGWADCVAAAGAGASMVEKHLCLGLGDPEGRWSLVPGDFAAMVQELRQPGATEE